MRVIALIISLTNLPTAEHGLHRAGYGKQRNYPKLRTRKKNFREIQVPAAEL